jgi:hypothetical protein
MTEARGPNREQPGNERLAYVRREAAQAFAAFDRGEGIETTPDELMDGIERELGIGEGA